MENKKKERTNKIFTPKDERWIIREVKEDPKISAPKLALAAEKYFTSQLIQKLFA